MSKITIPTLFFYGKQDKMISKNALWDEAWSVAHASKALILTDYEHVHNGANWGVY